MRVLRSFLPFVALLVHHGYFRRYRFGSCTGLCQWSSSGTGHQTSSPWDAYGACWRYGRCAFDATSQVTLVTNQCCDGCHECYAVGASRQGPRRPEGASGPPQCMAFQAARKRVDSGTKASWSAGQTSRVGSQELFLYHAVLDRLKSQIAEPEAKEAISELAKLEDTTVDLFLATFGPEYATPKDGRAWKWKIAMTSCALDSFRSHWGILTRHLTRAGQVPWILEPARQLQSQLTKDLWQSLKERTSSSTAP
eukprot:s3945_g1.t1